MTARDHADTCNRPGSRNLSPIEVIRRKQPDLQKGRARVKKPLHPVAGQHLPARDVPLPRPLTAACERSLGSHLDRRQMIFHRSGVRFELFAARRDAAGQFHERFTSAPTLCMAPCK